MEACVLGKPPPVAISVLRIFVAVKNRFGSYLPQENSFHDKLGHFSSVGTWTFRPKFFALYLRNTLKLGKGLSNILLYLFLEKMDNKSRSWSYVFFDFLKYSAKRQPSSSTTKIWVSDPFDFYSVFLSDINLQKGGHWVSAGITFLRQFREIPK